MTKEERFFSIFEGIKKQEWFPDFIAFCNSVYTHGLQRIVDHLNEGGDFAVCDYGNFPIHLINLEELTKMLRLFKQYYLNRKL